MALPVGSIFDVGNAVFFIGDSLEHDMRGARNVGMMTVYLKKDAEENIDETLCDLVVNDLQKLTDMITALEA